MASAIAGLSRTALLSRRLAANLSVRSFDGSAVVRRQGSIFGFGAHHLVEEDRRMLEHFKDLAARQVGKVLSSDATMKVLSSPQLKTAIVTAINLRAEARDAVEKRVRDVADKLELVTRQDVASMKRSIRDLEDHLADLRGQLDDAQAEVATVRAAQADAGPGGNGAAPARSQPAPAPPAAGTGHIDDEAADAQDAAAEAKKAKAAAAKAGKKRGSANPPA